MNNDSQHPSWCVPTYCTVRPTERAGSHASAPLQIKRPSGTIALHLNRTPNGPTLVVLEGVPEIVDPEVDVDEAAFVVGLDLLAAVVLREHLDDLIKAAVRAMAAEAGAS
jgi:hypothetical protein